MTEHGIAHLHNTKRGVMGQRDVRGLGGGRRLTGPGGAEIEDRDR